jgi:tetratricopeptide (TPR) repeat protein
LIVLEDIHWADELSLSLVAHLAKFMTDASVMLALTYRQPGSKANLQSLADVKSLTYAYSIKLEPLSSQESLDLVKITLGNRSIPKDVQQILLNRGQGNPFFLQEISRAILDVSENLPDQLANLFEALNLPDTVHDAIFMHIDRLPEPEKLTLKVASVIGVRFQRSLLSAVHPVNGTRPFLSAQLQDLENEKLIRMEVSAPKWEYVFRNMITQEILYEGLLLAQRRQLHTAVGAVLQASAPDAIESLAYHYSRSDNLEMALHYLKMAGQKASREYANHAAIGYYSEILARLADRPADHKVSGFISAEYWDALLERVKLYNLTGQRDKEVEDLGTLGLIAEALADDRRRALAAKQWAYHYETKGDYASALELTERFVQLAEQADDERLVGEGYNQWGKLLYIFRDYDTAQRYLQHALRIAQAYHDKSGQADCLVNLGLVAHYQVDYEVARYFFQEAVTLWREMGDQLGLGNGLRHLGQVHFDTGRYMDALQCYEQSLNLYRAIGDPNGEALTKLNLGQLQRCLGNYDQARLLLQQALQTHKSTGDRRAEVHTISQLGFLLCRLAEYDAAVLLFEEALTTLRDELDDPWALGQALVYYSWTLIDQGFYREARPYLQEAMQIGSGLHQEAILIESAVQLGRVALAHKDLGLASTCARHTLEFVERQGTRGIEHPVMAYLTSYRILEANQKFEHAQLVLQQAQRYVAAQASQIEDPLLQESYLTNVWENQEIQELIAE